MHTLALPYNDLSAVEAAFASHPELIACVILEPVVGNAGTIPPAPDFLAALMKSGRVRRAFLGIAGGTRPLPPAMAQRLGRKAGVEVQEVVAGSPAAAASLRGGDIIVSVGDVAVGKAGDLQRLMVEAQIGSKLGLSILRGGKLMTVEVVPVELA